MRLRGGHRIVAAACIAGLIAGCTPTTGPLEGPQFITVTSTGRRAWTVSSAVPQPGYEVGVGDDGRLTHVRGAFELEGSDGAPIRIELGLNRIGTNLWGPVVLTNVDIGKNVVGIVDVEAPTPADDGSTSSLHVVARGYDVYDWKRVPLTIEVDLTIDDRGPTTTSTTTSTSTSTPTSSTTTVVEPPGNELVIGRGVALAPLPAGEAVGWTHRTDGPEALSLAVHGVEPCPDLEVLDSDGTAIAQLGGCGGVAVLLPRADEYTFRAKAGALDVPGGAEFVVAREVDAGIIGMDAVTEAPALLPGQSATWVYEGFARERLGFAAWNATGQPTQIEVWDPDGQPVAASTAAGADRMVQHSLAATGSYVVKVTNRSAGDVPAGAIRARVSPPHDGGTLALGTPAGAPVLEPGDEVRWTAPAIVGETVRFTATRVDGECLQIHVLEPGNAVPAATTGCADETSMTATSDRAGNWQFSLVNTGRTPVDAGRVRVMYVRPSATTIAVGGSVTLNSVPPDGRVAVGVTGPVGTKAFFDVRGAVGECQTATLRTADSSWSQGSLACNEATGVVELEAELQADGASVLDVTRSALVPGSTPISITATTLVDVAVGELAPGAERAIPSLAVGQRATWQTAVGATPRNVVVALQSTSSCVSLDLLSPSGRLAHVADACPGSGASRPVVIEPGAVLRLRSRTNAPLAAGSASVSLAEVAAAVTSGPDAVRRPALARQVAALDSACKQVLFVGLRGSGQPSGYGPQVETVRNRVLSKLAGRYTITELALEDPAYPANPVPVPSLDIGDWQIYFNGINDAADALYRVLAGRKHCAGERIVLAGYSQGAMAVHRTVVDLAKNGEWSIVNRISGVVLIADGDRHRKDGVTTFGTADRNQHGITHTYGVGGARESHFGRGSERFIFSVCNDGDLVCDNAGLAFGLSTHTKYSYTQPVWDAANAAVANVDAALPPAIGLEDEVSIEFIGVPRYTRDGNTRSEDIKFRVRSSFEVDSDLAKPASVWVNAVRVPRSDPPSTGDIILTHASTAVPRVSGSATDGIYHLRRTLPGGASYNPGAYAPVQVCVTPLIPGILPCRSVRWRERVPFVVE